MCADVSVDEYTCPNRGGSATARAGVGVAAVCVACRRDGRSACRTMKRYGHEKQFYNFSSSVSFITHGETGEAPAAFSRLVGY